MNKFSPETEKILRQVEMFEEGRNLQHVIADGYYRKDNDKWHDPTWLELVDTTGRCVALGLEQLSDILEHYVTDLFNAWYKYYQAQQKQQRISNEALGKLHDYVLKYGNFEETENPVI